MGSIAAWSTREGSDWGAAWGSDFHTCVTAGLCTWGAWPHGAHGEGCGQQQQQQAHLDVQPIMQDVGQAGGVLGMCGHICHMEYLDIQPVKLACDG